MVAVLVVAPDATQAFSNAPAMTLGWAAPVSSLRMSQHPCTGTRAGSKPASPKAQGAARIMALVSALCVAGGLLACLLVQPARAELTMQWLADSDGDRGRQTSALPDTAGQGMRLPRLINR